MDQERSDKATGITFNTLRVTPAMAVEWLRSNHPNNRPIVRTRVEAIARDIAAGNWVLTSQNICFDGNGYLIDGQHRLSAIVLANAPVDMVVAKNPNAKLHDPIDRGSVRSVGFVSGVSNQLVAAYRTLAALERGRRMTTSITPAESLDLHARSEYAVTRITSQMSLAGMTGPFIGSCLYAMPCDSNLVLSFMHEVATGEMLCRTDPAYAYRSWRTRNARAEFWGAAMATLNCLRFAINKRRLANVHLTDSGYRGITTRRRAMSVPQTPSATDVPPGNFAPSAGAIED